MPRSNSAFDFDTYTLAVETGVSERFVRRVLCGKCASNLIADYIAKKLDITRRDFYRRTGYLWAAMELEQSRRARVAALFGLPDPCFSCLLFEAGLFPTRPGCAALAHEWPRAPMIRVPKPPQASGNASNDAQE